MYNIIDMKKILVTGADGFIGSHLVESLMHSGYDVKALCIYNSMNNWGWLETLDVKNKIEVVSGDIRDPFFCKLITKDIDTIFHLAALIAIPYSYVAPESFIETNVKGTMNICQAGLENNVNKIIHTSTSEVYGTAKYVPIDEKHPLQPQSPYSASKIGADSIAMSYFSSFGLPLTIARPFNTYGPRQSARAIIPTIITQILNGKKTVELGDVSPTRDFNYVSDTCNALINIFKASEVQGKTINIGSQTETSIKELLEKIKKLMDSDIEFIYDSKRVRPEASEVFRLVCDNSLIKEITDFETKVSLDQGLQKTIDWISKPKNLEFYKSEIYNV